MEQKSETVEDELIDNLQKLSIKKNYKKLYIEKCKELENYKKIIANRDTRPVGAGERSRGRSPLESNSLAKPARAKREARRDSNVKIASSSCITEIDNMSLWNNISKCDIRKYITKIEYLLKEFGTKELCNRFDVGNTIEYILGDLIRSLGYKVEQLPNAKRIDLCIADKFKLSVKYSSVGDITLHNSNSCINQDENISDLLLLTPTRLYLITKSELSNLEIDIKKYIKNTGDSLKLRRSLLTKLEKINYPYIIGIELNIDKSKCKNRLCSQVFYSSFEKEYYLKRFSDIKLI
jgi:hypothetical protein